MDETGPQLAPLAWLATAIAVLGIVVYVAGFVNNEKTMATATTRWPRWEWAKWTVSGAEPPSRDVRSTRVAHDPQ